MGENPDFVYNVGAIGLDSVFNLPLLTKKELEQDLDFKFKKYNYQVTFHPETLSEVSSAEQFKILLDAIEEQEDSFFVFTKANADTDGRIINSMIDSFVRENPERSRAFTSLGNLRYLSLLVQCNAVIGNSSSGIIEAPSLKVATINIGDRQKGRMQAKSVVNTRVNLNELRKAFLKVKNEDFKAMLQEVENPYGSGQTAERIFEVLKTISWKELVVKRFYNLNS
jgi:UDP-hydrolysing UDP-N-acetyl-D-glucosamine 2-epimerase